MIDVKDLILLVLAVSNTITAILYLVYYFRYRSLLKATVQVTLDKLMLQDHIAQISSDNEPDGFIKFLSESREWAFTYIEEVQTTIKNLKSAMEGGDEDEITIFYNQLIGHLPESKND